VDEMTIAGPSCEHYPRVPEAREIGALLALQRCALASSYRIRSSSRQTAQELGVRVDFKGIGRLCLIGEDLRVGLAKHAHSRSAKS
jgi:hypothetical protein